MNIARLIFLVLALALVACSNSMDTVIPTDASRWDSELRPTLDKLSATDRQTLVAYLTRVKQDALQGRALPEGVSVGSALEAQREFQKNEVAQRTGAFADQQQRDQQRRELEKKAAEVVSIKLVNKQVPPVDASTGNRSEQGSLDFDITNLGAHTIISLAGTIRLSDGLPGDLMSVDLSYATPLAPGESIRWNKTTTLSIFENTGQRLRNADLRYVTPTFTPSLVLLDDGTRFGSAASG